MNFIFPAAGLGIRFKNIGIKTPKPLILVHNIPLLIWAISNFNIKISDKVWIISQNSHGIEEYIKNNFKKLYQICNFINIDKTTSGPASTVEICMKYINDVEPVLIANTDQFIFKNLDEYVNLIEHSSSSGLIMTMQASGNKWSYLGRNKSGEIDLIVEKKQISSEATVGIYGFKKSSLFKNAYKKMTYLEDTVNGEYYVAPIYNQLIGDGNKVSSYDVGMIGQDVFGTGTPEDLAIFQKDTRIKFLAETIKQKYI